MNHAETQDNPDHYEYDETLYLSEKCCTCKHRNEETKDDDCPCKECRHYVN